MYHPKRICIFVSEKNKNNHEKSIHNSSNSHDFDVRERCGSTQQRYSHLLMTVTVFPDGDDAMYDAILIMKMREIKKDNSTQQ